MKAAIIFAALALGACSDPNHAKEQAENQKFADECNARGGRAEFTFAARQCIGLKPQEAPHA